ncbi:PON [Mytilus coruscus]|uniref:Paraoxonase n=1 Tax=Mytilus coruscus TaxID=42192 RepID=A0A6J8CGZ0_MYTCO|nr:PON [Mytilus coruscus]
MQVQTKDRRKTGDMAVETRYNVEKHSFNVLKMNGFPVHKRHRIKTDGTAWSPNRRRRSALIGSAFATCMHRCFVAFVSLVLLYKITLFVVNTGFDGGVTETIEVFEFKRGISILRHVKSISTEGRLMNDILAVDKDSFYATQYLEYYNNKYLSPLEIYGMLKLGKVWFYDGQEFKQVLSYLGYPNGINASPDLSTIYIAEFWSKQINAFKRQKDNSLHLIQTVFIDTAPDNIEVDPVTGDLWIGCHARTHLLHKYEEVNGESLSPSQVLKIKTKNGNLTSNIIEIFLDNGEFCSGSATASYYKGRLLVGTVGTELIFCDVLYNP